MTCPSNSSVEILIAPTNQASDQQEEYREFRNDQRQGGAVGQDAMETIRGLITKVTIGPVNRDGDYDAVLHGDLAVILGACDQARGEDLRGSRPPGNISPGSQLSVVAGARCHLYRTIIRCE
jgi:hypothetical protein